MFGRSSSHTEMRTPAALSAALHVVALVAAIAKFSFFSHPPIEPEPVMVEFEAIAQKAAAPTVGNPPPQPKDARIDKETTKAPPPKTAEPSPAPEPPKKEVAEAIPTPPKAVETPKAEMPKPAEDKIALKPKEPEPPKIEKPPEPKPEPKPEAKKIEKPVSPPPKPPAKPNVDNLIDSILKNQDSRTKIQTPEQQPKPVKEITRQAPAAPQLASVVTASEVEGVRQKIRPCWNFPAGVKDQDTLIVTLVVQMNQDGTPVKAELKDTSRYYSDPLFRAAADAAQRAILNPRCQPWPLSPEKFNAWRTITFNFDPRDY